jgi:7,8-dihydro-6-hydroxymethylpterin-pyrophosphokinase
MTTLNLNLEIAQQVLDQMADVYNDFSKCQIDQQTLLITNLYESGSWLGKSAKDFYDNYRELDVKVSKQLEEYKLLIVALKLEFDTWQKRAEHLSPSPEHLFPPGPQP